jgi:hypothetical protein
MLLRVVAGVVVRVDELAVGGDDVGLGVGVPGVTTVLEDEEVVAGRSALSVPPQPATAATTTTALTTTRAG